MFEANDLIGKREEITDMLSPQSIVDGVFKKGMMLKFDYEGSITRIRITRVDKTNKRVWGEHISAVIRDVALTHIGHKVESKVPPFCEDCKVTLMEPATPEGIKKYNERRENTLEDGTIIPTE